MFRGSSRTKDRARVRTLVPSADGPDHSLGLKHLFGASDHRSRAGLEPRVGRPPCSPTGEGPVCGSHNPRTRKNSRNYMRSPRRRKPAHERSQSMVTRQRPSRSGLPRRPALVSTWASRRRGRGTGRSEPGDRGAGWARSPAPLCSAPPARPHSGGGRTGFRDGRREPCAVSRRRHTATQTRRENKKMWTQDTARCTVTLLAASCTPGG